MMVPGTVRFDPFCTGCPKVSVHGLETDCFCATFQPRGSFLSLLGLPGALDYSPQSITNTIRPVRPPLCGSLIRDDEILRPRKLRQKLPAVLKLG